MAQISLMSRLTFPMLYSLLVTQSEASFDDMISHAYDYEVLDTGCITLCFQYFSTLSTNDCNLLCDAISENVESTNMGFAEIFHILKQRQNRGPSKKSTEETQDDIILEGRIPFHFGKRNGRKDLDGSLPFQFGERTKRQELAGRLPFQFGKREDPEKLEGRDGPTGIEGTISLPFGKRDGRKDMEGSLPFQFGKRGKRDERKDMEGSIPFQFGKRNVIVRWTKA